VLTKGVPVPDGATWCSLSLLASVNTSFLLAFGDKYLEVRILKDFKSNEFGSADSKGVTGVFFGSADSTGVRRISGLNVGMLEQILERLPLRFKVALGALFGTFFITLIITTYWTVCQRIFGAIGLLYSLYHVGCYEEDEADHADGRGGGL